ncbi:VOC family protein [Coxiella endosymbiont of Ornithodoros maritimus]|uniref:VOC family protein n=1 Tax=Coxiella endosymbiont of Ornithodoros maritimus TaxID=1656172 RepID=UPI002264E4FB|nr:VOC family protein [Coxiella endosymbiont of Ornithodoros maritimus]
MLKKVVFTMYPVEDINRIRKFYEEILGLKKEGAYSEEQWVEYDLPDGGCFAITTLAKGISPSTSSGRSIAFEVDDLDNLVSQFKLKGVNFKVDIFSSLICRMAVIINSEGNAVTGCID